MAACTSCGVDVTGKNFCPECGKPVQHVATAVATAQPVSSSTCPRCNGEVKAGAAFCMHCGSSLSAAPVATPVSQPLTHPCPACRTEVPVDSAFCTNCGQSTRAAATPVAATPAPSFCTNCGHQNAPGTNFCAGCGTSLTAAPTQVQTGQAPYTVYSQQGPYTQQPQQYSQAQYGQQPQYPQQQPYGQPQYGQMGYQQQPMLGQQPMVLRCPVCMAMAPMGTANCLSCHTSLAGVVPTPANMPAQGQQGGLGGFLQGSGGNMAVGALGGAAAVLGGEFLLHEMEGHHHQRQYDGGYDDDGNPLGGIGEVARDIGLL